MCHIRSSGVAHLDDLVKHFLRIIQGNDVQFVLSDFGSASFVAAELGKQPWVQAFMYPAPEAVAQCAESLGDLDVYGQPLARSTRLAPARLPGHVTASGALVFLWSAASVLLRQ